MICAYTLNMLDVMQTSANHYEVGIGVFYFVMLKDHYMKDEPFYIFYQSISHKILEKHLEIGYFYKGSTVQNIFRYVCNIEFENSIVLILDNDVLSIF